MAKSQEHHITIITTSESMAFWQIAIQFL